MPTVALFSGLAGLIAGAMKYGIDAYRARRNPPKLSVAIGDQSIEVPRSCTPEQVAALIAVMQKGAVEQSPK
jgi:hypothetical protein